MKRILAVALIMSFPTSPLLAASDCTEGQIEKILEKATKKKPSIRITCNFKLKNPKKIITKKLIFEGAKASNLNFDCNEGKLTPTLKAGGADVISIRSKKTQSWSRPENIEIRNCKVKGSIRVYGMGKNGEAEEVRKSSRGIGHTKRAQAAAPTNIRLNNLVLTGSGRIPLYISPGVTNVQFTNSEIKGKGSSVALYLDAESAHNLIQNNYIHLKTKRREQLAVDGSAHNKIIGNRFSGLNHGGIYVYRNCGEGGTVRHQKPTHNQIINNVFYYKKYRGFKKAIFIGSRNTVPRRLINLFNIGYCHHDNGANFGSSKYNRDFAQYNVVAQNQIVKRSARYRIKNLDKYNYFYKNISVKKPIKRKSGCYIKRANNHYFIEDGDSFESFRCDDGKILTNFK